MCIVIDTNTIHCVFSIDPAHADYKPILDWILNGKGKLVYGGSQYIKEVFGKKWKYQRIFKLLDDYRKICELPKKEIDKYQLKVKLQINDKKCNDSHLIAIFNISNCRILCSNDYRSYKYLKNAKLYKKGKKPPKIYSKSNSKKLLCDKYIDKCCNPKTYINQEGCVLLKIALGSLK